ncbi:MAG: tRNA lysidine(34) synthetase TilS [Oscillospiraceae bacterium]|nr:tRNA lysidine(34) synthetase TilS [Oscillospiraceae bacterium]
MDQRSVKAYMEARKMLPARPRPVRVLIACSGGADSVALLDLLAVMEGVEAVCAHFNHCLRGAESDRDEAFVRALCAGMGVPFHAGRGDVAAYAAESGKGIEEAAREKRYRFLRETAERTGCARIATAHNADDNAETVLFHLLRGAGTRGLGGIPPVRDGVIRPLLNVRRSEILAYLAARGLEHMEDSSNADARYARNDLRSNVLPALERINAGAVAHICAAAELLREDEEYLDGQAEEFLEANYCPPLLPLPPFLALPKSVAMRALRRLTGSPGREHLERLYALCRSGRSRAALDLPGLTVAKEGGALRFGPPETPRPVARRQLPVGGVLVLPEDGRRVICGDTEAAKEIHNSFNTFYFKNANICGRLYIASRAAGDAIRLAGRGCTKSLRKLFSEARLSPAERTRRLVVSDEQGPVAVEGFGVAERCAAERGAPCLRVEILPPPERKETT